MMRSRLLACLWLALAAAGCQGGADGSGGGCRIADPQELELKLCEHPWPRCDDSEVRGPGRVIWSGSPGEVGFSDRILLLQDDLRAPQQINVGLPGAREFPVALGDRVQATYWSERQLYHRNSLRLESMDGLLLYQHINYELWDELSPGRCPMLRDSDCGEAFFPQDIRHEPPLEQGLVTTFVEQGTSYRLWVGRLWRYLDIQHACRDAPVGWIEWAEVTRALRSACRCEGDVDCARGEVCEPISRGCVRNACASMDCDQDHVCDPFRGECVPRPARACQIDAECGKEELCHPVTHACVPDVCRDLGCAPCSPFLGGCYGCLHDCDCGLGLCDRETRTCVDGCQLGKLDQDLRQENASAYDHYHACLEHALDDPTAVVSLFESAAQCEFEVPPNVCPVEAPVACAIPLEREAGQDRITADAWARLCHLSRNPLVQGMVGGHERP